MRQNRVEPELANLRKHAESLADQRRQALTSAHLLASIAAIPSASRDLLVERRLTPETILAQTSEVVEDLPDPVRHILQRSREIGANMGSDLTLLEHVLLALLNERRGAAQRTIVKLGVDVGRLRSAAMNVALGVIRRRRIVGRPANAEMSATAPAPAPLSRLAPPPPAARNRKPSGVAIPLIDPETARALPRRPGQAAPPTESKPARPAPAPTPVVPKPANERVKPNRSSTQQTARRRPRAGATNRLALDPKRQPLLGRLGRNLTLAAERGELDPVIGREAEIERTLDVLAKRHGNNPILVGRAGVGKTSVVRGLAQRIAAGVHTDALDDRIVVELSIPELIAGTGVRGALAEKLANIRKEVAASEGRVVLFFDDIHQLFVGDAAEELAADLKLALARGELPCIGTSTHEDYARAIDGDAAVARRFTLVEVDEPNKADAFLILDAAAQKLAEHHGVAFGEAALAQAVAWSVRYLPGIALPDKAIGIADLAGARTRRRGDREVGSEIVAEVVAELADMPIERLLETDVDRMIELEQRLADRVVGHEAQIHRIARILRRNTAGLGGDRPLGSFLLLGPTGVGKTETAKAIAHVMFHSEQAMTRIDLAEYGEQHAVARLIGAPPGYVGHEAGGQLTEAVRRRPYQVVLLDEIEKAHPDVLISFLALLDEGRLTDGRGRTVDFSNTVILMTSNLGADVSGARRNRRVGFGASDEPRHEDIQRDVTEVARTKLAPELYNRIDEVLVFAPLGRQEVRTITRRLLERLGKRLEQQRGVRLQADDAAIEALLEAGGYDPTLGARPMKRAIARWVEAPIADRLLQGDLGAGDVVWLTVDEQGLCVDIVDAEGHRGSAAE
jgi:ATP-dependent Clp protease ATP-binding subunit ClpC